MTTPGKTWDASHAERQTRAHHRPERRGATSWAIRRWILDQTDSCADPWNHEYHHTGYLLSETLLTRVTEDKDLKQGLKPSTKQEPNCWLSSTTIAVLPMFPSLSLPLLCGTIPGKNGDALQPRSRDRSFSQGFAGLRRWEPPSHVVTNLLKNAVEAFKERKK